MAPREPLDDTTDITEVQTFNVPDEELEDTNYVPPPPKEEQPKERRNGGALGEDALRNQIAALQRKAQDSEKRASEAVQQLNDVRRQSTEEVTRSRQEVASSRRSQVDTARAAIDACIERAAPARISSSRICRASASICASVIMFKLTRYSKRAPLGALRR